MVGVGGDFSNSQAVFPLWG